MISAFQCNHSVIPGGTAQFSNSRKIEKKEPSFQKIQFKNEKMKIIVLATPRQR